MFVNAVRLAAAYTFPYVGLRRRTSGEVQTSVGSFVVINAEGWIVTSGHIVDDIVASDAGVQRQAGPGAPRTDSSVAQHQELWALPGFSEKRPALVQARVNRAADVAVGRLEPFDPSAISGFPVLRDVSADPIEQGMSVCRVGYPFHDVPATYNTTTSTFEVPSSAFPFPRFVLDGVVSRFSRHVAEEGAAAIFIETSTPGLRGQSGGPLLDVSGRVCGIQSQTAHLDLGFDARFVDSESEVVVERQFLNVGAASHVNEVRELLDAEGAEYRLG